MATNTVAWFLVPVELGHEGGAGVQFPIGAAMHPESQPSIIWGQGTPDGDRSPFNLINKGSMYMSTNQTDDYPCVYMKVDEGGDDDDWVQLLTKISSFAETASATYSTIDLNITATMAASVYYAGLDVAVTLAGTSAVWASAAYFKIEQEATKAVNGYISGVEIELINAASSSSAMFPLVLNYTDNATANVNAQRAFIALREYGTAAPPALMWLGQEFVAAVGSSSNTVMWTTTGAEYEANVDYAIRFIAGNANTPYWIPVCSTGPAG
jgi:hypothetical protein